MKMENIKSILLTNLVCLSLILTWSLWTYHPSYDVADNSSKIQNVFIGKERTESDLIAPTQMVFHNGDQHVGTMDQSEVKKLYENLRGSEFSKLKIVSSTIDREKMAEELKIKESIEFIFPVSIPTNVFMKLYSFADEEISISSISRIIIPINGPLNPIVYFLSNEDQQILRANVTDDFYSDLKDAYLKFNKYATFFSYKTKGGNVLFLPEQPSIIDQVTYSSQRILASQFKRALFNDPALVKQYSSNNGEESYTDGARALEVFYAENKMRYINPTPETYNMDPDEFIFNSIEYVNNHAGWTDDYLFFSWSKLNQSTEFRLFVSGYPVYNGQDGKEIATINQTWRNHEIYEYTRSLVDLSIPIGNQVKQVKLPSGRQLIDYLENAKVDFDASLLEKVIIGYEVSSDNSNAIFVSFKPAWFVQYNNVWEKVMVPVQGGNVIGLE